MSLKNKFKTFFTLEDEYEYVEESVPEQPTQEQKGNVVNFKGIETPTSKVVLLEPGTYDEVQEIADNIINRRAVVINLQRLDHEQAKRIVDFLSGTVYAVSGDIQKLGADTFLCTPDNIDVAGSISDPLIEEEFNKGW